MKSAVRRAAAAVTMALLALLPTPAVAAAPPPPVAAVVVRGTPTPLHVTISWTRPTDPSYAGARVVVVAGTTPTSNPVDAAAVLAADVAAPATSLDWSGGIAGRVYSASVFAYDATGTAFAGPASAAISLPGPIKHLATDIAYGTVQAFYVLPPNADAAVLCQRADRVPTTPADATTCSSPRTHANFDDSLAGYDDIAPLAVFSVDTATGIYGPGVSMGDGALPPMSPHVVLWSASPTRLGVTWTHSTGAIGFGTVMTGGTVRWELLIAPGTRTPVGNPAARRISILSSSVSVDHDKYGDIRQTQVPGLVPDLPYTVAMRGFDAAGNSSDWSNSATWATGAPATRLDQRGTDGVWRTAVIPGSHSDSVALAVEPSGVSHVLNGPVLMRRSPGRASTRIQLPRGLVGELTLAGTRSSSGTIALADRNCVWVRRRAWTKAGCLTIAPLVAGQRKLGLKDVFALEVDRRGAVHALYSGYQANCACASLHYASNRSGRWVVTRIRNIADRATGEAARSAEKGVADLTYDPVTDKVVVVIGDPAANGRYTVSVGSKAASGGNFLLSVWFGFANSRAVVPQDVVSYGNRITIAARRADAVAGKPWATPVLLTAAGSTGHPSMAAIPGTRADDANLSLAAASPSRVLVGWNHTGFSTNEQGVWTTWRTYDGRGRAATSRASRRTRSAYDVLAGVGVDLRGRLSVLYRRAAPP